jgi:cystathionine gamma-lyase
MPPIYATSTYAQSSPGEHQGFEYSRTQNPTRFAYERCVASLEGGTRGFAFASGMAASSTVLELLDSGSHVVAMDDLYGGSFRLFERVRRRSAGLDFSFVDLTDLAAFEASITPKTRWSGSRPDQPDAEDRRHRRDRRHRQAPWPDRRGRQHLRLADAAAPAGTGRGHRRAFGHQVPQRPLGHGRRHRVVGDNAELAEQMAFLQNSVGGVQGRSTASWPCAA